jgi:hypothetical protein
VITSGIEDPASMVLMSAGRERPNVIRRRNGWQQHFADAVGEVILDILNQV